MKKFLCLFLLILCSMHLCGCTEQHNAENSVNGDDLFPTDFCQDVTAITLRGFDEKTVLTCTDADKISSVMEILRNADYEVLKKENYVEGCYFFEFILGDEVVPIGISGNHIGMKGDQYETGSNLSDDILQILEFQL